MHQTCYLSVLRSNPIKDFPCFLEQEALSSLLSTDWFEERIRAWLTFTKTNEVPWSSAIKTALGNKQLVFLKPDDKRLMAKYINLVHPQLPPILVCTDCSEFTGYTKQQQCKSVYMFYIHVLYRMHILISLRYITLQILRYITCYKVILN